MTFILPAVHPFLLKSVGLPLPWVLIMGWSKGDKPFLTDCILFWVIKSLYMLLSCVSWEMDKTSNHQILPYILTISSIFNIMNATLHEPLSYTWTVLLEYHPDVIVCCNPPQKGAQLRSVHVHMFLFLIPYYCPVWGRHHTLVVEHSLLVQKVPRMKSDSERWVTFHFRTELFTQQWMGTWLSLELGKVTKTVWRGTGHPTSSCRGLSICGSLRHIPYAIIVWDLYTYLEVIAHIFLWA